MTISSDVQSSPTTDVLRLLWPQWQGATPGAVAALAPELSQEAGQTGYGLGSAILNHILPAESGRTIAVPVPTTTEGLETNGGIYAREQVLSQVKDAVRLIDEADPDKIVTLGGECSVSVAPFAHLAAKYGEDLAVVWFDAHADCTLPGDPYDGYHAMALSHLTSHGDEEIVGTLPATVDPSRVALAGVHSWTEWDEPTAKEWGIQSFSAKQINDGTASLLAWLKATGCSKIAVHLDLDVIDSKEIVLGLGMEPDGLSRASLIRAFADLSKAADIVGVTVAEYVPRQVIAVRELLASLPLPK
ncbi:arginase family protein [Arthrobacter sp. StoSoilB20]|uniref:arginase family protein n=1 Tax=Arthrobacter sp. StoSoilB20 TaxID=2830995 RepID=UPI001CC4CE0F|nr:arginase family protein [Arthrobacter sp. StoSoilB20]BCW58555.1 arginase [Arthrobacter sp. StoSoilB20]